MECKLYSIQSLNSSRESTKLWLITSSFRITSYSSGNYDVSVTFATSTIYLQFYVQIGINSLNSLAFIRHALFVIKSISWTPVIISLNLV